MSLQYRNITTSGKKKMLFKLPLWINTHTQDNRLFLHDCKQS